MSPGLVFGCVTQEPWVIAGCMALLQLCTWPSLLHLPDRSCAILPDSSHPIWQHSGERAEHFHCSSASLDSLSHHMDQCRLLYKAQSKRHQRVERGEAHGSSLRQHCVL